MSKSKLGRNPFQLKTTPVENNPLFSEGAANDTQSKEEDQADPVGILFAAEEDEPAEDMAPVGLVAFGLLKGYALIRGLMIR